MKKVYCDRCGKEVEQNHNIILRRASPLAAGEQYYDLCPSCKEAFIGWINGTPVEQEKPYKVEKPQEKVKPAAKPSASKKSNAYTIRQIAELSGAPVTTVRRHAEGICSTYSKDKQGRTIRRYHLTDDQLAALIERIKGRKQGQRTKI